MSDIKKIDDGGPKVTLTTEQWEYLSNIEAEKLRDQIRHNAEVREILHNLSGFLTKKDDLDDKRDWFAGQALPAIIERCGSDSRPQHETLTDYFARKAFEVADAMLIARKGGA